MFPLPALDGRRVLVLGATGFIGRWVARCAGRAGADCVLQARSGDALEALRGPYDLRGSERIVDLAEEAAVADLLGREHFDLVINLVGYGVDREERDEELAGNLNSRLPSRLASSLESTTTRLIHVGSALEYGEVGGDLDEEGEHRPGTLYGRTKLEGTRALAASALARERRCLTARLFTVYGPGEHEGRLLPSLVAAAREGTEVELSAGRQRRDFDHVEEVARALLALMVEAPAADTIVNVARGRLESVRDFCDCAARVFGISPAQLRFGAKPTRPEEMSHEPARTRRLERALGRRLEVDLEEGLQKTREFLEETT